MTNQKAMTENRSARKRDEPTRIVGGAKVLDVE
jgi:hypothetical protein